MSNRKGIMLCYPFEEKRLAKWKPPWLIQPKLDGDRCRAYVGPEGKCTLISSEDHTILSVPHIKEAIESLHLRSVELDGELYIHGAPHSEIHSIVSRTENMHPDYKLMEYHIFDMVSTEPQMVRTQKLISTIPFYGSHRNYGAVQLVPNRIVATLDEIMATQEEFARAGYEGFVIRNLMAPYIRRRSTMLMKFKPRKEDIYEIKGVQEEISKDGAPKGSLGALICTGSDGTLFNVGSGSLLTREARQILWSERETLPGKWARVKYQHLTSARGVPRFPVVVEIVDLH